MLPTPTTGITSFCANMELNTYKSEADLEVAEHGSSNQGEKNEASHSAGSPEPPRVPGQLEVRYSLRHLP